MPGYQTKQERIAVAGVPDLSVRSLLDREQFCDPMGEAERLGISSAAWPLFGLLWPSGAQLAARLALRPVSATERILELGCGLALASLVGHRRGADVTASDCHPLAGHFLRENLRLNALLPMKYRHGHWGRHESTDAAREEGPVLGRFELIIGSDVLYERGQPERLSAFIAHHAHAAVEVIIVDPDRGNRPHFNRCMDALGFARSERKVSLVPGTQLPYKGRVLTYHRDVLGAGELRSV